MDCDATADVIRAAQIAGLENGGIKNDFKLIRGIVESLNR